MQKTYIVTKKEGEKLSEFYTRLANEIQVMKCKIILMDIEARGFEATATIVYQN